MNPSTKSRIKIDHQFMVVNRYYFGFNHQINFKIVCDMLE